MTVSVNKIVLYLLQIPLNNIQTLLYSGLHSLMDLVLINEIESPVKGLRSDLLDGLLHRLKCRNQRSSNS